MSEKRYFSKQNIKDITIQSEDGGGMLLTDKVKIFFSSKTKEENDKLKAENFKGNVDIDPNTNSSFMAITNSNSDPISLNISNINQYSLFSNNNSSNVFSKKSTPDCKDEFDDLALELLNHENIYSNGGNPNLAVGAKNNVTDLITNQLASAPAGINLDWNRYGNPTNPDFQGAKDNYLDNYWNANNNRINPPAILNANQIYISKLPPGLRSMAIQFSYNAGQWFTRMLVAANTIDSSLGYPYEATPNVDYDILKPIQEGNGYVFVRNINGEKTKDKIAVHPKARASINVPGVTYFVSPTYDERQNKFIQQYPQIIDLYNKNKDSFLDALKNEHKRFYLASRKGNTERGTQQRFVNFPNQFDIFYADYVDKAYNIALKYKNCSSIISSTPSIPATPPPSTPPEIVKFDPPSDLRGKQLFIYGKGFINVKSLRIGGKLIPASDYIFKNEVETIYENIIIASTAEAASGKIEVETDLGIAISKDDYIVIETANGIPIGKSPEDEGLPENEDDIVGGETEPQTEDIDYEKNPEVKPPVVLEPIGEENEDENNTFLFFEEEEIPIAEEESKKEEETITFGKTKNKPKPKDETDANNSGGSPDNNNPPDPGKTDNCPDGRIVKIITYGNNDYSGNKQSFNRSHPPGTPSDVYLNTAPICPMYNLLEAAKLSVGTFTTEIAATKSPKTGKKGALGCAAAMSIIYARCFGHSVAYRQTDLGYWVKYNEYKGPYVGKNTDSNDYYGALIKSSLPKPPSKKGSYYKYNMHVMISLGTATFQDYLLKDTDNWVVVASFGTGLRCAGTIPGTLDQWLKSDVYKLAQPGDWINSKTVTCIDPVTNEPKIVNGHIGIVDDLKAKDGSYYIINNTGGGYTGTVNDPKLSGSIQRPYTMRSWYSGKGGPAKRADIDGTYLIRFIGKYGVTI